MVQKQLILENADFTPLAAKVIENKALFHCGKA